MIARVFYFIRYLYIFAKALALANYQVAKLVLTPNLRMRPGFIAVPMEAQTDFEITALANSITLTPGTISVHVARDRKTIVIHAIDIGQDPEAVRRDVIDTLESNILKWTRSGSQNPARKEGAS